MLFLSGCQLCSNCFHTLSRAIKEEKKNEEEVGSSKSERESKVGHLGVEKEKKERLERSLATKEESLCVRI